MNVLTLIGNGFDLGHGLPTQFFDFIMSNPLIYKVKYADFRKGDGSWNAIEFTYEELLRKVMEARSWQDLTEETERILGEYGLNDYGEVDFYNYVFEAYDEEFDRITDLIVLLEEFEKDFLSYLREYCNDKHIKSISPRRELLEIIKKSRQIITFNYTHTAELLYGAKDVIHIHGDVDSSISIGSGALEDAKSSTIDYEYPSRDSFSKTKDGLIDMMILYRGYGREYSGRSFY